MSQSQICVYGASHYFNVDDKEVKCLTASQKKPIQNYYMRCEECKDGEGWNTYQFNTQISIMELSCINSTQKEKRSCIESCSKNGI